MSEQDMAVGALFRQCVKEVTIAECAKISRSSRADKLDQKDARNHILLLTGAIDGYIDQHGRQIVSSRFFIKDTPYPDEADKVRELVARFG